MAEAIFPSLLDRLLRMIIFPDLCEYGISWDRIDASGNALLVLIALNPRQFQVTAENIIMNQPDGIRQSLINSFDRLSTERNVKFNRVDKLNRQAFAQNLRGFIVEVRPLVTYQ